ncbi:hypothetical protein WJX79_000654 [Trebouxia sp. C0005]
MATTSYPAYPNQQVLVQGTQNYNTASTGGYSTGLCSWCAEPGGCGLCMSGTFCCCCQYGRNVEKLSPQQATCGGSCCGAGWLYCLFYHFGLAVVPQCITRGEIRRMNGLQAREIKIRGGGPGAKGGVVYTNEVSPADNGTASPSGLLAPVRFKVPLRQADGTFPPSLYGWAANVQSRMSGTLEDIEDEQQASSQQTQPASDATRPSSSGRKSAHQVAAEHQQEVAILQELLKKQGLTTLPLRLNSGKAELIRYAIAAGALRATSEQEKSSALQRAALSIQATAVWLAEHKFLSREEMQQYKTLVWWEDLDSQNRPILIVRLGQALNECKSRAEADRVAECIVSQINYGVLNFMDDQQGPEKLVVILDCRGASAFQASKLVRLMKSVAVTLNQHYPSRLQQLFFVEPPAVMKWPIQAAKPLLHADTGNKIQVCSLADASLPVNLNGIPDSW